MKRNSLIYMAVCLFGFTNALRAQQPVESIGIKSDGTVLGAKVYYSGSESVFEFEPDDSGDYIMLRLRSFNKEKKSWSGKGKVQMQAARYTSGAVWSQIIDYKQKTVSLVPSGVLSLAAPTVQDKQKTVLWRLEDGTVQWTGNFVPLWIDTHSNRVLGYKNHASKNLQCYNLSTKEKEWERELKKLMAGRM